MLNQKWKNWVIILSTATVLSACGSTHTVVKEDGTAGKLDWPNPASVSMDQNRGIFPDLDNLKQIRSGMSRDQLYALKSDDLILVKVFACENGIIYSTSTRPIKVRTV